MIILKDSKKLVIEGLPLAHKNAIKRGLRIKDPKFEKMKAKLGKQVYYRCKEFFKYYTDKDGFTVPKGTLQRVMRHLKKHNLEYEYERAKVVKKRSQAVLSKIVLRDYQEPLIQEMRNKDTGIISLSTGGGKSIIALKYAAECGLTTTILVNKKTLLHQFKNECKEWLGYDPGIVGDGKKEIKDITIAMVQTLKSKPELLQELANRTSVLIVDECQEYVTEKAMEVLGEFYPEKMFGLTATPYRSTDDGRTDAIKFIMGDIIASHTIEAMKPSIEVYSSGAEIEMNDEYHEMVKELTEHEGRNRLIAMLAVGEIAAGRKVLILTKRVAHAERLAEMLPAMRLIQQDTKGKVEILKGMKDGSVEFCGIIGTYALLGTGFDVPVLDRLILAGEVKSNVLTTQSCGRILRLLDEKDPVIYDIFDSMNPVFSNQFRHRNNIYKKNGWKTTFHTLDKCWDDVKEFKYGR